ncbi:MAG: EscV/YscV/HrcV family type III secretion system export apparatus protein, partial [Firmicutes bacterium HGW-Firmicutes-13]
LIPALPFIPFFILSAGSGFIAYTLMGEERTVKNREKEEAQKMTLKEEKAAESPENIMPLLRVEVMEIEIGYNLIALTDKSQGGDLLDRITATRRQCAQEMGILVAPIRIRDNLQLDANFYVIKIKGIEIARYSLIPGYYLALNPIGVEEKLEGIDTQEPTFGLPAIWIPESEREKAELLGYTVVDASTVLITHLTEVIKSHAHELLGRQEVKAMVDTIKESYPAVIEELIPDHMSIGEIQKVLQNLLKEKVPIKDLLTIFEALADHAPVTRDIDLLTEYTRQSLSRTICNLYTSGDHKLLVLTIDPHLENRIAESLQQSAHGTYPVLEPSTAQKIIRKISSLAEKAGERGIHPVVLCSPRVRLPLRRLTERVLPDLTVLSLNEIISNISVESIGTVSLDEN